MPARALKLFTAILFGLLLSPTVQAQVPSDQVTIQKVEQYLNSITTLRARFSQMNSDGTLYNGTFLLWRPGRLRFEYDPPNKDYIVADGRFVNYWDDGAKNYSNAPIGSTLADFLLSKRIRLSGDIKVTSVRRPAAGMLVIAMTQKSNPEAGDLRLLFSDDPMGLQKWRITDATGQITEVTLSDVQTGVKLDPTLFRFKPPKGYDKDWKNR